jgi:hypothetical protein
MRLYDGLCFQTAPRRRHRGGRLQRAIIGPRRYDDSSDDGDDDAVAEAGLRCFSGVECDLRAAAAAAAAAVAAAAANAAGTAVAGLRRPGGTRR